jgi:hypothetical protein
MITEQIDAENVDIRILGIKPRNQEAPDNAKTV